MKKLKIRAVSVLLLLTVALTLCSMSVAAADNGDEYVTYYDFNSISGDDSLPDSNWSRAAGHVYTTEGNGGGKAIELGGWAEPVLLFPQTFETGVLRVGMDVKLVAGGKLDLYLFKDPSSYPQIKATRVVPIRLQNNGGVGKVMYTPTLEYTAFGTTVIACDWTPSDWNRVEMVLSMDTNKVNVYLNNTLLTTTAIDLNDTGAFKGLGMRGAGDDRTVIVDNVTVSRTAKSGLVMFDVTQGDRRVALTNGSIDIRLTEAVSEEAIENGVVVTHNKTGQKITNFTVTQTDPKGFNITFDGAIEAGTYSISLNSDVKGVPGGATNTVPLEVTTMPETVDVGGALVVRPQTEGITLYDYEGNVISGAILTSMISRAEVTFNTLVNEASAVANVLLKKNGEAVDCTKTLADADGKSTLTLTFDKLLDGGADYSIGIDAENGVGDRAYPQVATNEAFAVSFKTNSDEAVLMFAQSFSGGKYSFKVAKNTKTNSDMTVSLCEYEDKACTVNGEAKTLPMLKNVAYKAIELSETDGGITTYEISAAFYNADTTKIFVWSYPKLLDITAETVK